MSDLTKAGVSFLIGFVLLFASCVDFVSEQAEAKPLRTYGCVILDVDSRFIFYRCPVDGKYLYLVQSEGTNGVAVTR